MLLSLFIFFEVVIITLFLVSFFTHQEILWMVTALLSGVSMFTSYDIQYYVYSYNATIGAYSPIITTQNYPYLMGINMIFFALAIILGIFDIFDKYGGRFSGKKDEK